MAEQMISVSKLHKRDHTARNIFLGMVLFAIIGMVSYLVFRPLALSQSCASSPDTRCACPADPTQISKRNLIIVDTTDPIRAGKLLDIEELIKSITSSTKPMLEWLQDGKRPDQISVFLLSNVAPPDMRPIAVFCTQPPAFSTFLGNTKRQIRDIQSETSSKVASALVKLESGAAAEQSPIIETLSILTSNSSVWRPGGTLVLVSDLLQNTSKCGFFERAQKVPTLAELPASCLPEVTSIQEKLRHTESYPGKSLVAICQLPGKIRKDGLLSFWREIFQN